MFFSRQQTQVACLRHSPLGRRFLRSPHRCERCALTKHLYCCTGTMAQLPTYRLTTSPDCFFTRLNRFRTTGNNDGRPFFARLICFRTTDKFGGIPCRICIAILIHIEDRHDDLVHITSEIVDSQAQKTPVIFNRDISAGLPQSDHGPA